MINTNEYPMKQVLIIDDDPRNIFALKAVLRSKGFSCLTAGTAAEGLAQLDAHPGSIGIILMDIMMPDMDGYEAIGRIKSDEKTKNIPVIAVTAKAMVGDREKCLLAGASDYIPKPINVDLLLELMHNFSNFTEL